MLQGMFDDSRISASYDSENLLFPTRIVRFSPTNKLWASATVIVRTCFCSFLLPFLSLTVTSCFPGVYREMSSHWLKFCMASLSHALSPKLITFFSMFITPKDLAKAHTTLFFLEGFFGKASMKHFTAFPKFCQLIFAGEMLAGVPTKIFLPSCQWQLASQCFWQNVLWFWQLLNDCTHCSSFNLHSSRLFCCSLHSSCLCLFDFAITWARKRHWI